MTPEEKAEDLVLTYFDMLPDIYSPDYAKKEAKRFALVTVNELLEELYEGSIDYGISARRRYFEEVKEEIEKL